MVGGVVVKVTVPVERGVAPLVAALGEIPGVVTIMSGER